MVWQLADYCESIGVDPSVRLQLRAAGLTEAACLDFDLAVRAVKRMADGRQEETEQVPDTEPEHKKPRRMKTVPKYPTLRHVLGLAPDQRDADLPVTQAARDLADAFAAGDVDWSAFGLDGT